MYDKDNNQITFPHVIPMPELNGKKYNTNDINGGTRKIADMDIETNSFWGGNCVVVGMINELGFYACPNRYDNYVMGFYVHDGSTVTERGKTALANRFPGVKIVYDNVAIEDKLTDEEIKRRNELKLEAVKMGIAANLITHTTAKELEGLIKAVSSGVNNVTATVEEPVVAPASDDFVHVNEYGDERPTKRSKQRYSV